MVGLKCGGGRGGRENRMDYAWRRNCRIEYSNRTAHRHLAITDSPIDPPPPPPFPAKPPCKYYSFVSSATNYNKTYQHYFEEIEHRIDIWADHWFQHPHTMDSRHSPSLWCNLKFLETIIQPADQHVLWPCLCTSHRDTCRMSWKIVRPYALRQLSAFPVELALLKPGSWNA